jgi:hypothetical protein
MRTKGVKRMLQKLNTILLCLAVSLLALIAWREQPSQIKAGRFQLLGDKEEYGFDTETGRVCITWPEIMKEQNPRNTPNCYELR